MGRADDGQSGMGRFQDGCRVGQRAAGWSGVDLSENLVKKLPTNPSAPGNALHKHWLCTASRPRLGSFILKADSIRHLLLLSYL
jgi:hypothetical protein